MNLFKRKTVLPAAHDAVKLNARVGLLAKDDSLWPQLLGLVKANVEVETQAAARPGISNEEAHRGLGRIGAFLDLEAQLQEVWEKSHKE